MQFSASALKPLIMKTSAGIRTYAPFDEIDKIP